MKYSKQRESIKNYLKQVKNHPTAEEIFVALKPASPDLSLGTVYRNLRLLSDMKAVLVLESSDGKLHYDGNTAAHDHFVCTECGRIFDISESSAISSESYKSLGNDFKIESHALYFYGACLMCEKSNVLPFHR